MKRLLAAFVVAPALFAAVSGTVMNRTTDKPQANAIVSLVKLGQGMENAGSARTDAQGRFEFPVNADPQSPYLLQVMHGGVNYNKMLQPGSIRGPLSLDVFETSANAPAVQLSEHIVFLQPGSDGLGVQELYTFENKGKTTYLDAGNGTFRFFLPEGANGQVRVSIEGAGSMPIQREPEKTAEAGVYRVNYPVKPGPTRFTVLYSLPAATAFESRTLYKSPINLVAPAGVAFAGQGLEQLGVHPQTQATLYRAAGPKVALAISGTPAAAPAQAAEATEDESGGIEIKKPLIYSRLPWIVALGSAILALGFALLYRKDTAHNEAGRG